MQTLSQLKAGQLIGITSLTLSEELTTFPLEILSLADTLEVLDLSNNHLSSLPNEFAQLHQLKIMFASNNQFKTLPAVLGQCKKLEMVGFKSNQICEVANDSLPSQLRWLILTDNHIETMPDSLGERPRLQKLALAGNKLRALPQTLAQASNLELIRISANQLTECPMQLLDLPKLAWIAFAGNPFSQSHLAHKSVPELPSSSFVLGKVLGQGASGIIYQGSWKTPQEALPNNIAIKVFKGQVTSDGYPSDELQACLSISKHDNFVQSLAQVNEEGYLALIMDLIAPHYSNLAQPPSLQTCTRDTFAANANLSIRKIVKIVQQMQNVLAHLERHQVCHGDFYAHNTLVDDDANVIFGDFGASSMYHMLNKDTQVKVMKIEQRAFRHFISDLLTICADEDKDSEMFAQLQQQAQHQPLRELTLEAV